MNRDSLITHINEEGIKAPVVEEKVPFEAGKKRGKVYVPKYSDAEMEAINRAAAVAESVRLDDDEEAALGTATVNDLVNIYRVVNGNQSKFKNEMVKIVLTVF